MVEFFVVLFFNLIFIIFLTISENDFIFSFQHTCTFVSFPMKSYFIVMHLSPDKDPLQALSAHSSYANDTNRNIDSRAMQCAGLC